ncbi:MAG TPA: hypothetical protein VMT20_01135 [Terriglobia bacterium]|nr:hypothetical protein [Terriglobia bacterium]
MRVLGDIDPRPTARLNSSARADDSQRLEGWEKFGDGQRDISDIPLKITDERYRLECDRLREDALWQTNEARGAASPIAAATSVAATAVEKPEGRRCDATINGTPLDLGSVSNDLTQEQRERAANELFARMGYVKLLPPQKAGAPWKVVLVLVLALAALVGYGYLAMRQNGVSARRLPGVQTAMVLNQRFRAAQSKMSADLESARDRSQQLIAAGRERWARWRR